jgi:hypothetical protein
VPVKRRAFYTQLGSERPAGESIHSILFDERPSGVHNHLRVQKGILLSGSANGALL